MQRIATGAEPRRSHLITRPGRCGGIVVGTVAAVLLAAASAAVGGRVAFERGASREVQALFGASRAVRPTIVTEADLATVPKSVQRWLRYSQVVGKERPVTVRLKQQGQLRLGQDQAWMPFEAEEYYTTDPPGFVWPVQMRMALLLSVTGWDRYVDGVGSIQMRLLSVIPVANKCGGGLNQGGLLRYLNETMWFPAAALSPYITWEGGSATSARATMSYGGETASATFMFDDEGRLTDMVAQRYNDARGRLETWSTPIGAYGEFEGVRVPVAGEGVWKYETGDFPYIRLRVTDLDYNQRSRY
jgi:hypothetical protein